MTARVTGSLDGARGQGRPFRRKVFFIPGFDPFPPRRYRELYRREAALQAQWSGHALRLTAGADAAQWQVDGVIDGRPVHAAFEVLVWADLVRATMDRGIARTYLTLARTAWVYGTSGALARLVRLRRGPVIAAFYPVVMLVLQLAVALALGAAAWTWSGLPYLVGAGLGAAVALAVLAGFRRLDRHLLAQYLLHDFAYSAVARGAWPPGLQARLSAFAACIRAALDQGWDEVLVVGHSSGVHLGVSALAEVARSGAAPGLAFLSLGQAVPMVSFLPGAARLRGDLAQMAAGDIPWVDITAPSDGGCFALCDPVAVSGVAPPRQRWPLVLSAAYSRNLRPATWTALRWRFFRLHFQYLCAFDALPGTPDDYDYFRITAGPLTLPQRFGHRRNSPQRIARPLSPHVTVAPGGVP